ncbi:MAG: tyrosine-type recombinase/integrase [Candidatus Coatesbacteria bacterium]|nr:tyrosine-type recombinase/integrase [Candidatus Coatesbacteria bacterium]
MRTRALRNIVKTIEAINEHRHKKRNTLLVLLGIYTGLRISELLNLDIEDIKINGKISDAIVFRGKGRKTRQVPLSRRIQVLLEDYLKNYEVGPLFVSQMGKRMSRFQAYVIMRNIAMKTSQTNVATHSLRKTFAQSLLDAGVDVETMRVLLGHSSISVTQRYIETDESKMFAAVGRLSFG